MEDLPEGLLSKILVRLPLKDLLRSKSTCKRWMSLISSRLFSQDHARSCPYTSREQIIISGHILRLFDCDSFFNFQPATHKFSWMGKSFDDIDYKVVGCCDGLVCLIHRDRSLLRFWLWNPATRESYKLRLVIPCGHHPKLIFGFGYDHNSDDYKIITVRKPGRTCLYSVKSSSCKTIPTTRRVPEGLRGRALRLESNCGLVLKGCTGVHLNSRLHWPVVNTDGSILSFDLKDELFLTRNFMLPGLSAGEVPPAGIEIELTVISEMLCVCMLSLNSYKGIFPYKSEAWVMKEYGVPSSWTKLYAIDLFDNMGFVPLVAAPDGKDMFQVDCVCWDVSKPVDDDNSWENNEEEEEEECSDQFLTILGCKYPNAGWVYRGSLISPRTLVLKDSCPRKHGRASTTEKIIYDGFFRMSYVECDSLLRTDWDLLSNTRLSAHRFSWTGKAYDDMSHKVIGICNGLVLMCALSKMRLMLWNPATREIRKLRDMKYNNSFTVFGFGYDSVSDDYKVVVIPNHWGIGTANVYSLRRGSFRIIPRPCPSRRIKSHGVYLNGCLHWPSLNEDGSLLCLDLNEEIFLQTLFLPGPTVVAAATFEGEVSLEVGVIAGCLSICLPRCDDHNYFFYNRYDVWVMKRYGQNSSWTKLFRTVFSTEPLTPLVETRCGEIILDSVSGCIGYAVYNPESDTLSHMEIHTWKGGKAWTYKPSLVSPLTLSS